MPDIEDASVLEVPARRIPVPTSISPEARAVLARGVIGVAPPATPIYPALDDLDGWRQMIAAANESVSANLTHVRAEGVQIEERDLGGVRTFVISPPDHDPTDLRVYLDIHGGALIHGAGDGCRAMGLLTASRFRMRVWAPDYRMPPDHPYPAPLDDCVTAYRLLLEEHSADEIVVGGGSAGGNLAAALILRARDEGLPLPAAAVLLTPEVDLTESGDSFQTLLGVDTVGGGQSLMAVNLLYAAGHDLADPYLSPLFGDFTKGFPTTILTSGTRDFFLSNTVRMHRALQFGWHSGRTARRRSSTPWRVHGRHTRGARPQSGGPALHPSQLSTRFCWLRQRSRGIRQEERVDTTELHQCCERVFGSDRSTTVVLVTAFKVGDPLVLSEPVTDLTVAAPADLFLVKLVVGPGNPGPPGAPSTSPGIGIEVWLPPKPVWNRRIHNIGGLGGYDGGDHSSPTQVGWFYAALTAGNEGAVSASTDSGHTPRDGTWAMNPDRTTATQLWTDFAHRAMHEMAVKTKALATAFYGSQPSYSYYEGSSTGGRHGYRLAQQYPEDYDGIVANLPTVNFTEWSLSNLHRRLIAQRDLDGVDLTEEQMDLVSNAAINACDVVGREHLGYIFDNESCHYDPTTDPDVLCVSDGGSSVSPHCVTKAQAMAINKMWYGPTRDGSAPDPAVDNGVGTDLNGRSWYGLTRGTSLYVAYFAKRDPRMREVLRAASSNGNAAGSDQAALVRRDPAMAGPSFQNESGNGQAGWRDLTYQQLADTFELGVEMEQAFAGIASNDADLSRFKERGGKFLSWHGWNDESIPVQTTMRYYDRVVETMGGLEEVQAFYKLYLVPGGGHMSPHGTSNEDANPPAVAPGQFYRLIVDWVENGVEPGRVEIKSPASTPAPITQPIFPYPQKAVYAGGDPRISSSYIGS